MLLDFFLFKLWFSVPVNVYGQVGTLPQFNRTCIQNQDVMTSKLCFKYNYPTKPVRLICVGGLTKSL